MTEGEETPRSESNVHSADGITLVDPGLVRRAVAAAAIGNVTEWFDFGVFAYMATTIGKVFYPQSSPTSQLLATFGTFAAAFLVRPIGGLFFGPLGDRIGRTRVLATTMILMATGTFCIGLIPSHATIGLAAPILLLLARLVQGFSTGGEYGGAMTFIAEYAPDKRRGFLGSFLEFGTLTGYILGAVIVAGLSAGLSEADLLSWGWRIPFLVAGPLGVVGMYLRLKLEETPAFAKLMEEHEAREGKTTKAEFREIFVKHWPAMLVCGALVLVFNVTNYMLTAYMPTYLSDDLPPNISETESYVLQIVVMAVMLLVITFIGRISDRVGRKPVITAGCIALVVLSVPSVLLIRQNTMPTVFGGLMIMGLMLVVFSATMPSTLPALFPTRIRQGALSISFNISVSLFGGTVATVMTALVAATGDLMWPAYYLIGAGIIGGIGVWFTKESAARPLPGSTASVETEEEAKAAAAG
ncbi:MFS transporter [Saccharopolyspora phatthalungensis]|uniref:Putative proline/betaine transporter n=1 Tax=Saccharopolyspora phatthalungensis TaxID=664693 RepID=A0A840QHE8_9PSEU|nr:MFS transporter [Saccharopolyspora phatthalungensis]MBB5159581.1 MHS family proline/betaine transporter-like MFS transporter [Saccharopolyspora phatthalungensis]